MGSRGRRDAEFQGGKNLNLHFNKLVSGVRVGRDVHKNQHTGGQISLNFEAIDMAATLTSCNYLRGTWRRTRYGQSDTHVVRCDVDQPIDHPLRTFGRHHGPKPWRARPMPEGPERRLTIQCATYRTQCSRADRRQRKPLQNTTSIPCGLCCNLPRQEGTRTSQKCYRSPSIQNTCHNPEESIPRVALQAVAKQKFVYRLFILKYILRVSLGHF